MLSSAGFYCPIYMLEKSWSIKNLTANRNESKNRKRIMNIIHVNIESDLFEWCCHCRANDTPL
jgi:hypothetical protein